ncbi:MAG: hypothetical protein ACOYIK_05570, partial [Coriobacteriales bacterium]
MRRCSHIGVSKGKSGSRTGKGIGVVYKAVLAIVVALCMCVPAAALAGSGTSTGTDSGTGTVAETETVTATDTETGTDTGTATGTEASTDASTDTSSESGTDTGTVTGTSNGTGTDSGSSTGTKMRVMGNPSSPSTFSFSKTTIEIPYGVDITTWLTDQKIYEIDNGSGTSTVTGADLIARGFFDSAVENPLEFVGQSYPAPGATIASADLQWGQVATGKLTPDLTSVEFKMGKVDSNPNDTVSDDLLQQLPDSIRDNLLTVVGANGEDVLYHTGSSANGDSTIWICDATKTSGIKLGTSSSLTPNDDQEVMTFSNSLSVDRSGKFSSSSSGETYTVTAPGTVYVKMPKDVTVKDKATGNYVNIYKGQIVKLQVSKDTKIPTVPSINVKDSNGKDIVAEKVLVLDGNMVVYESGVQIKATVTDPAVTETGEVSSGLDNDSVKLNLKLSDGSTKKIDVDSIDSNGLATFSLKLSDLSGQDTIEFADMDITASDKAGNQLTKSLSGLAPVSGKTVNGIKFMDKSKVQTTVTPKFNNNTV